MIRDRDYIKIADEYSTTIGMATMVNYMDKSEVLKKGMKSDDLIINEVVTNSIDEGIYTKVIRKVYELQRGRRGRIKDSTIYKRAYQLCK